MRALNRPDRRSPSLIGPTSVRTNVITGWPTASSIRRTTCLRPSCSWISTRALPGAESTSLNESTLTGPSSSSMPARSSLPRSRGTGPVKVDSFKLVDSAPGKALVEIQLHEGRKHVVRRMLDAVGHPVITLVRTDVGPIKLGDLRSGRMRALNRPEIGQLYSAAGL